MKTPKRYPDSVKREALDRYTSGESRVEISEALNVNVNTIYYWLKHFNVQRRPSGPQFKPVTGEQKNRVWDLRRQGYSLRKISAQTGISLWIVRRLVKEYLEEKSK